MHRLVTVLTATAAAAFAFAPSAGAATSCDYEASGILSVTMTENFDTTLLAVSATGNIQVRAQGPVLTCTGGTPTVTNTDNILVIDNSDDPSTPASTDGHTHVSIINPNAFAPGRTQEQGSNAFSEIEFLLNLNNGSDDLFLSGAPLADDWRLGKSGINFNAGSGDPAADSDLTATPLTTIQASGDDGDDTISAQGGLGTGAPVDRGFLNLSGDGGNDTVEGGSLGDLVSGGPGNDTLRGFGQDDRLVPAGGDDVVDGGAGSDTADYATAFSGAKVDLSDTAPQSTGQGTDTLSALENVDGSPANDTLIGNASPNRLVAVGGDDTLDGRGGDDALDASIGNDTVLYDQAPSGVSVDLTAGNATGGAGSDAITGAENVVGSPFADSLTGNADPNTITAGAGIDIVRALAGADTVEIRDGGPDTASCGTEIDTATADKQSVDAVDADCETTSFLPEDPAPPSGGGTTTPPGDGGAVKPVDRSLSFSLSGAKAQRLLKTKYVLVKLRCPLEACTTIAKGAGKSLRKGLRAGSTKTLKLKLTARRLKALRKAGKRAKVKVTVKATDAAGNIVTRTLTVAVKR